MLTLRIASPNSKSAQKKIAESLARRSAIFQFITM
jgi:hypothetical protein